MIDFYNTVDEFAEMIEKELGSFPKAASNRLFGDDSVERKSNMKIKKVYFNEPATVVLWDDGTKTIVKSGESDIYDPEKGLAMAIAKKALGNNGNYYDTFKKWLPEEVGEETSPLSVLRSAFANIKIPKIDIHVDENSTLKKEKMYTPEELAEKLGVTKATIQRQCREGKYSKAVKVGGKWMIPY